MSKKKIMDELTAVRQAKAQRKRQTKQDETSSEQSTQQERQEVTAPPNRGRDGMPARRSQTTTEAPAPEAATGDEELVVFAFRLTRAERDRIHAAAGSAKASKFVRELAVAAAQGDGPTVLGIVETVKQQ